MTVCTNDLACLHGAFLNCDTNAWNVGCSPLNSLLELGQNVLNRRLHISTLEAKLIDRNCIRPSLTFRREDSLLPALYVNRNAFSNVLVELSIRNSRLVDSRYLLLPSISYCKVADILANTLRKLFLGVNAQPGYIMVNFWSVSRVVHVPRTLPNEQKNVLLRTPKTIGTLLLLCKHVLPGRKTLNPRVCLLLATQLTLGNPTMALGNVSWKLSWCMLSNVQSV